MVRSSNSVVGRKSNSDRVAEAQRKQEGLFFFYGPNAQC